MTRQVGILPTFFRRLFRQAGSPTSESGKMPDCRFAAVPQRSFPRLGLSPEEQDQDDQDQQSAARIIAPT